MEGVLTQSMSIPEYVILQSFYFKAKEQRHVTPVFLRELDKHWPPERSC